MKQFIFLTCLIVSAAMIHAEEETTGARLLIAKHILNKYLVEKMDCVIKYTIFNIGDTAALDVDIIDNSFPKEDFDLSKTNMINGRFDRVPPNTNVSHTITVVPLKAGYYNFSSAEVNYKRKEDDTTVQVAYSSEPGAAYFIPFREYDKRFSSHVMDWVSFAVMTLPSLAIPFILWFNSKTKYEALVKSNKKH